MSSNHNQSRQIALTVQNQIIFNWTTKIKSIKCKEQFKFNKQNTETSLKPDFLTMLLTIIKNQT